MKPAQFDSLSQDSSGSKVRYKAEDAEELEDDGEEEACEVLSQERPSDSAGRLGWLL